MSKRLFLASVEHEVIVYAEDEDEARDIAQSEGLPSEITDDFARVWAREITWPVGPEEAVSYAWGDDGMVTVGERQKEAGVEQP